MTPAAERDRPAPAGASPRHAASPRHTHTAFGLGLELDPHLSIPGLAPASGGDPAPDSPTPTRVLLDPEELERRWARLDTAPTRVREVSFEGATIRTIDFAEPAGYLLCNRDHGRVLISPDGRELLCEPDPANGQWTAIVAAQALPLAATLRGYEVLHASGVALDGRALLMTGPAGAGKSSLAAALVRAGGRLLSDDAVALRLEEGALMAYPGSLALQLRAAEDGRLSAPERAALGTPEGEVEGKRRYVEDVAPPPVPLGALFLLERSAAGPTPDRTAAGPTPEHTAAEPAAAAVPAVEPLAAVSPFALLGSTFNLSVRTPERLRRQLDVVGAIAAGGLVYRLRVQPGIDATALAGLVQAYLGQSRPREMPAPELEMPAPGQEMPARPSAELPPSAER